jgi:two-component system phosphate regulon sensor histidine kinase PhoR
MRLRTSRRTAFLAALFVILPVVMLIVVGVLVLVFQTRSADVTFGVLILSFCAALLTGAILLVVMLKRQADISRLQADFLSKVSHDFRTPLTSIRMFIETLRENRVTDPHRRERVLALLAQEAERLSTLIDRLLELSRLEAGRMHYDLRPVQPGEVIQAVAQRFEPRMVGDVHLELTVAPDLPNVHADPDALAEVLQNLVDNAFKYTGPSKAIGIEAYRDGRDVILAVSDNGPGIARHEHARVFDRFYRVDDRLSRVTEGTGLGLAISHHVVLAMGGRIYVDDRYKGGARFVIALPARA